ncbi:MAG TPA: Ku protein [Thermoanaerobaculia bacterium]|nr:Ku protein [Thermoanaerobaculia bacterium]
MPDEESSAPAGLRSFWSGSITFGLVNVPVALYPATRGRTTRLRMVDEGGNTLQRRYVCSKDGQDLDWDDIVRGYEVKKGKFVVVTDEELEAVEPRKSRDIDLQLFVDAEEIDPMLFERAYYLVPAGGTNKAYRLLAEVMERSGRAGIATFVMRAKEYLVAILAERGILRAETLRFADEIRKPADVGLPKVAKSKPAAVKKFETEIGRHGGHVNLREFLDVDAEKLEKLIARKQKQHEDVIKVSEPAAADDQTEGADVVDIMEVLQRTLRGASGGRRPAKRAPARKRTTSKKRKTASKRR